MDTQALAAFVSIVDEGSFSGAAASLHLTQPAVSKRVAVLEQQLGAPVFERGQRRLQLTDAGQRLLPFARRILDELHNARLALASQAGKVTGDLNVIASHHIGLHHLPAWLRQFTRQYPEVNLNLQFMDSESAFEQMRKRHTELAFVTLNDAMSAHFQIFHQWPDPMAFVVGKQHLLAQRPQVALADLAAVPAILPDTTTATYRAVSRLFLEAQLPLQPRMPTNYLETIKMMTSVGLGWSVLPVSMLDSTLQALATGASVTRMLGAVGVAGRQLSPAAEALLSVVRRRP
ncbi:MAG: LysR family transcriptional regulator [Marinobacter sp.]|nr:LysR family transcriptional regulator [Marinobacter sp.]